LLGRRTFEEKTGVDLEELAIEAWRQWETSPNFRGGIYD
jgi:hypothetical protein